MTTAAASYFWNNPLNVSSKNNYDGVHTTHQTRPLEIDTLDTLFHNTQQPWGELRIKTTIQQSSQKTVMYLGSDQQNGTNLEKICQIGMDSLERDQGLRSPSKEAKVAINIRTKWCDYYRN